MVMPLGGKEGSLAKGTLNVWKNHNRIPVKGSRAVPVLGSREPVQAQGSCEHPEKDDKTEGG